MNRLRVRRPAARSTESSRRVRRAPDTRSGSPSGKWEGPRCKRRGLGPYEIVAPVGAGGMGRLYFLLSPTLSSTHLPRSVQSSGFLSRILSMYSKTTWYFCRVNWQYRALASAQLPRSPSSFS